MKKKEEKQNETKHHLCYSIAVRNFRTQGIKKNPKSSRKGTNSENPIESIADLIDIRRFNRNIGSQKTME